MQQSAPAEEDTLGLGLQGLAGLHIAPSTTAQDTTQGQGSNSMLSLLNLYEGRGPGSTSNNTSTAGVAGSLLAPTGAGASSSASVSPCAYASAAGIANKTARAVVLRLAALCTGDGDGLTRRTAARALGTLAIDPAAGENEPLRVACYAVLAGVARGDGGCGVDDLAADEAREALKLLDALYEEEEKGEEGDEAAAGEGRGGQPAPGADARSRSGTTLSRRGTETYI